MTIKKKWFSWNGNAATVGRSSKEYDNVDDIDESTGISVEPTFDREPPLYLLYPSALRPGSQAPKTTLVSGKFRLNIKREQHILAVIAKLVPCFLFRDGDIVESGTRPPLTCQVIETERLFPAGHIELPFAFEIPADHWGRSSMTDDTGTGPIVPNREPSFSAWYSFELHIVRLSLPPAPSTSTSTNPTTATTTAGSSNSANTEYGPPELLVIPIPSKKEFQNMMDHSEEWRNNYHRKFFALVISPVDPGELPAPLEASIEEFAPPTGPISIILTSRSLCIGALITFSLHLPAMPEKSTLKEVRGLAEQVTSWRSIQKGVKGKTIAPDIDFPHRRQFFSLVPADFVEDGKAGGGSSISASTSASIPDDRCLNPSTASETKCPMICKHAIIIELEVIDENGRTKIVKLRHPIFLASCMLIPELLRLPRYDSQPIPKNEFQPQRPHEKYACACGFTLDQLIQRENEGLLPAMSYEPPPIKESDVVQ